MGGAIGVKGFLIWSGGAALLAATLLDVLGMLGRHLGVPLHGVIELIQPAVLYAGCIGLLLASLAGRHATVNLLADRLPARGKAMAALLEDIATVVFMAALLAGSVILALDLWSGHEVGELTGVPWRWMRGVVNVTLIALIGLVLVRRMRGRAA